MDAKAIIDQSTSNIKGRVLQASGRTTDAFNIDYPGVPQSSIITAQITLPKNLMAEFNTHGKSPRNAASSRAIPFSKMLAQVQDNPYVPRMFDNERGMQGFAERSGDALASDVADYLDLRDKAVATAKKLADAGVHKQVVNRLIEPWMFTTIIATSADWANYFWLRTEEMTEPQFRHAARDMYVDVAALFRTCTPRHVWIGESVKFNADVVSRIMVNTTHHTPMSETVEMPKVNTDFAMHVNHLMLEKGLGEGWFNQFVSMLAEGGIGLLPKPLTKCNFTPHAFVNLFDFMDGLLRGTLQGSPFLRLMSSAGRCARVSYNNLSTGKPDIADDLRLAVFMALNKHFSPFVHPCIKIADTSLLIRGRCELLNSNGSSHFQDTGYLPLRSLFAGESVRGNWIDLTSEQWFLDAVEAI